MTVAAAAILALLCAASSVVAQEVDHLDAAEQVQQHIAQSREHLDAASGTAQQLRDTASLADDEAIEKLLHQQLDQSLHHQGSAHEHLTHLADLLHRDADEEYLRRWRDLQRRGADRMNAGGLRVHSVAAVVWRADHEGVAAQQTHLRMALERHAELKLKLVQSLSRATRDAHVADALAAREPGHTQLHARLDAHLHTTVAARRALNDVVEARLDLLAAQSALSDAHEREQRGEELLPLPRCEATFAKADAGAAAFGARMRVVALQLSCLDQMRAAFKGVKDELQHVPSVGLESGARGICNGVKAIFSSATLRNATSRACGRMRFVGGQIVDLGLYRIGLKSYKCSATAGKAACSGHGVCAAEGKCHCANGWTSKDCSEKRCASGCRNGFCDRGSCRCSKGFAGKTCSLEDCPFSDGKRCAGVGMCLRVRSRKSGEQKLQCQCPEGRSGDACERSLCPYGTKYPYECSDRGVCKENGKCSCYRGFSGEACEERSVVHGVCNEKGGCLCDAGWTGAACDLHRCPADCSDNGVCDGTTGACECERGWRGLDCGTPAPTCPLNATQTAKGLDSAALPSNVQCSGRGLCRPAGGDKPAHVGVCVCPPGWAGPACAERDCPKNCSGRGVCNSDHTCTCFTGFSGDGCDITEHVHSVCAAECGRECLKLRTNCSVSRMGGMFNMNARVYGDDGSTAGVVDKSEEVAAATAAAAVAEAEAAEAVKQLRLSATPKTTACYLACSRKCVVERCWARGAEVETK